MQHYSELYSRENVITDESLNNIECLPVLEELDSEPTLAEIKAALDFLTSGKAPRRDNIPVEVLKRSSLPNCMKSFVFAGGKVEYHKT